MTYANLDKPQLSGSRLRSSNKLDLWVLSELNTLVRDVTTAYEAYDVTGATRPIEAFVEKLSTWYLRRSRRRFWKSGSDADKHDAYSTLYTALITVSKLIAPAMPFLADELYQNLVRSVDELAPESVHLSQWPLYDPALIDEALNRDMSVVISLASLGHAARQKANRRVRQPLQEAAFWVGNAPERGAVQVYSDLIADELNVKHVRLLDTSAEAVSHTAKPLPKQLGQKYGSKFPAVQKAILAMDAEALAHSLQSGGKARVVVDGESLEINADEVEVKASAKHGFAVAEEGTRLVALVTQLTPALIQEGQAREIVRRVQDLRRSANLEVADRIHLFIAASEALKAAVEAHRDYIMTETLAVSLDFKGLPDGAHHIEDRLEDETLQLGLLKAG